jgi:hypothetical protein
MIVNASKIEYTYENMREKIFKKMKEPVKEKIKKIFRTSPFFNVNTVFFQLGLQLIPVPTVDGLKTGKSMAQLHAQDPFFPSARHLPEERLKDLYGSSFTGEIDINKDRSLFFAHNK